MYWQINSIPTPLMSWRRGGPDRIYVTDTASATFGVKSFVVLTPVPTSESDAASTTFAFSSFTASDGSVHVAEADAAAGKS